MDKTIEPVNFNASRQLIDHIDQMFDKLVRYNDQIVKADIYLKSLRETPERAKKVEVRVFLPGKDVFVEQEANDFISAAQKNFDRLKVILAKEKDKLKSHH
ncbi:MAG: HPF/RaiA family ribosome-associated protein [Cryomorphaceae bacterium]